MERRLAAILVADVVGYSRLVEADEEAALATLGEYRHIIDGLIGNHRGRVFGAAGDSVIAEFASPVEAVRCATEIQQQIEDHNKDLSESQQMHFRIGINLGDVLVKGGDLLGDGVNVAARLEGLANARGICISGTIFDQVEGKLDLEFDDLGPQKVRNISKPVRVYGVRMDKLVQAKSLAAFKALPLPDKPSIAVLPFTNMSGDPEQEYFSDGITEDIITELSRFRTLFVIARNSSFAYKSQSVDLKQIAQELGVRYVLEGSVRRAAQRVRVTAQLIDVEGGKHIWAERYDRELEDIFALQEEITKSVVGSIAPQIEMAEIARVRSSHAANVSAYDLALKAQALLYDSLRVGSPEIYEQALDTVALALEHDPRSINALWVQALALADGYLYRWGSAPDETLNQAWRTVDRLVDVDSSDSRAYTARGFVHHFRGDHEAAVADLRYAFSLNPNLAINIFLMAWSESLAGHTQDAKDHAALALRLSPRDNEIWLGTAYLAIAQASFAEGDFEETEKWAKLAVQMHPRAPIRRALMTACCVHKGDIRNAREHLDFLNSFAPDFVPSILRGELVLYRNSEHNELLIDGLRKAQSKE